MKVLVTGAGGEVAPGVVRALARHCQLRLLDLARGDELPEAEWVLGSILDAEVLARALAGVEAVVHLAIAKETAGRKPDTQEFFDVNVKGPMNVLRAFLPAMIERGHGVIINISSGWGRYADALAGPYCASKFAVEGLTSSLAKELPEGLAAMTVSPGGINSNEHLLPR